MSEIKNLSAQINLTKLTNACITNIVGRSGNKVACVVIPVEANDIYLGQNDAAYLNLSILESREVKFDQTHFVKQAFSKDFREANPEKFTKEERMKLPILGNCKPLVFEHTPVEVNTTAQTAEAPDDLPF